MSGANSILLAAIFDAAIPRHTRNFCPQTARNRAFLIIPLPPDGSRHSRPASDVAKQQSRLRTKPATMVEGPAMRRQLQHAADGEYPFTDPATAGMRRKFDLPRGSPIECVKEKP